GADPRRQDRGDDRARAGGTLAVQRAEPGGRALRGRRGAPPGAGGGVLLTLAALAVVLGPLIFVHEMGHFLAAKAVGVQVLRFSIGFGRPLWRRRWGETGYWLAVSPLGCYVKLATPEGGGGPRRAAPRRPHREAQRRYGAHLERPHRGDRERRNGPRLRGRRTRRAAPRAPAGRVPAGAPAARPGARATRAPAPRAAR